MRFNKGITKTWKEKFLPRFGDSLVKFHRKVYMLEKKYRKTFHHQFFFGVVIIIVLTACKFSGQSEQILISPKGTLFFAEMSPNLDILFSASWSHSHVWHW